MACSWASTDAPGTTTSRWVQACLGTCLANNYTGQSLGIDSPSASVACVVLVYLVPQVGCLVDCIGEAPSLSLCSLQECWLNFRPPRNRAPYTQSSPLCPVYTYGAWWSLEWQPHGLRIFSAIAPLAPVRLVPRGPAHTLRSPTILTLLELICGPPEQVFGQQLRLGMFCHQKVIRSAPLWFVFCLCNRDNLATLQPGPRTQQKGFVRSRALGIQLAGDT